MPAPPTGSLTLALSGPETPALSMGPLRPQASLQAPQDPQTSLRASQDPAGLSPGSETPALSMGPSTPASSFSWRPLCSASTVGSGPCNAQAVSEATPGLSSLFPSPWGGDSGAVEGTEVRGRARRAGTRDHNPPQLWLACPRRGGPGVGWTMPGGWTWTEMGVPVTDG